MKRMATYRSLWSVLILLVAIVSIQMAATNEFFSSFSHHGSHVEMSVANAINPDKKRFCLHLDFFDIPPTFSLSLDSYSHNHLFCSYFAFPGSVLLRDYSGRSPPA